METSAHIEHFRQILTWPLQLSLSATGKGMRNYWDLLTNPATRGAWQEVADEFTENPEDFSERHYFEFVNFLPFVQRILYGEAGTSTSSVSGGRSPIRTFRRCDVSHMRVTMRAGAQPVILKVVHTDLYFFFDTDIAILSMELSHDNLTLDSALETLDGVRRAYPIHWDKSGHATRCPALVEWLDKNGGVIAVSNFEDKKGFLSFACQHRTPRVASHWEKIMEPFVPALGSSSDGPVRYRQIEDDRIPSMVYLACDDPGRLHRADFVRMAFGTRKGNAASLPYSERFLIDFEPRYCYDRYWDQTDDKKWSGARYLCTGSMFCVVGGQNDAFFTESETGLLGQFRHQIFLLGLIVHFHKAALLTMADRLSMAVNRLDPGNSDSVREFQREVRYDLEMFLRFSHRYWFHEVSNQQQASDLFHMWSGHLGNQQLYDDVRLETHDINEYLDSARTKKMSDMGMRLGVVATFGFVGAVATSFMGMNIIDETNNPVWLKVLMFLIVLAPTTLLTFYTIAISRRLADFLDVLASERYSLKQKTLAAIGIWKRRKR